jgi:hypothetical protein
MPFFPGEVLKCLYIISSTFIFLFCFLISTYVQILFGCVLQCSKRDTTICNFSDVNISVEFNLSLSELVKGTERVVCH